MFAGGMDSQSPAARSRMARFAMNEAGNRERAWPRAMLGRAVGSFRYRRRVACSVTDALNNHFVRQDLVEDEIGIGKHSDPSKAALADPAPRIWVRRDEVDDGVDAVFDVSCAQQGMPVEVGEDIL
jgi:hypothetical protein